MEWVDRATQQDRNPHTGAVLALALAAGPAIHACKYKLNSQLIFPPMHPSGQMPYAALPHSNPPF